MKVEVLGKNIMMAPAASTLGGAIPYPGASHVIDLAILITELDFQRKHLQINMAAIKVSEEASLRLKLPFEMHSALGNRTLNSEAFDDIFSLPSSEFLLFSKSIAYATSAESALAWILVVGPIIRAPFSAVSTKHNLTKLLKANQRIVLVSLKVISEMDL